MKNLVKLAAHPERLHIAILNQIDETSAEDQLMQEEINSYIQEA